MKPVQIKSIDYSLSTIVVKKGFSLIELMIVISLFAIITILATISYISFEGGQRLKNGALQIKSDLRMAQSSAQSGDKGAGICLVGSELAGWYATFNSVAGSNLSYTIAGDCLDINSNENSYSSGTYNLPQGVTISSIDYGVIGVDASHTTVASIFFKPLDYQVTFFGTTPTPPDFTDDTSGVLKTGIGGSELVITLYSADGTYKVKINSSGQVSESKT